MENFDLPNVLYTKNPFHTIKGVDNWRKRMDLGRIELPLPLCKSGVLPLNYRPEKTGGGRRWIRTIDLVFIRDAL